ncbi:hypothetical protein K488DRAFT_58885, partial [Vararia minispora EC-137]
AAASVLDTSNLVTQQILFFDVNVSQLPPVPALEAAGMTLINIWEALETIETHRFACLRLTECGAQILLSVREEILDVPTYVVEELQGQIGRLEDTLKKIYLMLQNQRQSSFLKLYSKREEMLRDIKVCDWELNTTLDMFGLPLQIRVLKLMQASEPYGKEEADLGDVSDLKKTPVEVPFGDEVTGLISHLRLAQNRWDHAHDLASLHQLMRTTLETNSDAGMIEVLQVPRDEIPEAIKTLQRMVEREMERTKIGENNSNTSSAESSALQLCIRIQRQL